MFVQCPFCQTKLSVSPDSIPEMGKEKRCVNCMNRFRIVRTDEELIVHYQTSDSQGAKPVEAGRSERSLHGNLTGVGGGAVQEKRYSILEAGGSSFDPGGGSGVFADFLNINEVQAADEDAVSSPLQEEDEVPIEQALKIDQVFDGLSSDSLSPADASRPVAPRILSSKDLHDRQERGFRRDFRAKGAGSRRRSVDLAGMLSSARDVLANLTPLDGVLIAAVAIVLLGAALGFTDAGVFGMNWIAGPDARPQAARKQASHGRFTKDEVYNLINLTPEKKEERPATRFNKDGSVLPEGDYSNLFVEDVEIAIRSIPSGATVYRGEQPLGATPLLVRMGKTDQMVVLRLEKEGFEPETLRFVGAESRAFDLPLRVLGAPAWRETPKPPAAQKPAAPKEGRDDKAKGSGDDFIIY